MIMQKPSVYKTDALKRYCFPTHCTDLIIDRKDSEAVEVFFAVLKPGEKTVPHKHDDCEQLWHVVEGCGTLFTGPEREEHAVRAGDVVLARRNVLHSVENSGPSVLRYLAIDVFVGGRPKDEPTWDSHVAAVCRQNGWNVSIVDVKHER
jgi:mannose-6-phosphate isomerase-like protein (cupin superfamily)